ncbi:MAG: hypoxanthine phosphoribosyltransferase [Candidatus Cloacimonetes bacterium]|nr:hypoxanthine phosphoribosyltransferase [Candidatus Cloacimonadota bacterium]
MNLDLERIIIDEIEISRRVKELGRDITKEYQEKETLLICILRGAVFFFADLCRAIDIPILMGFVSLSSYKDGTTSSGKVEERQKLMADVKGKHVILVEDIVDTGLTLEGYGANLLSRGALSVKICALLKKPEQKHDIDIAFKGFDIENRFVVGYGLDYAEHYRNLPYIGILKKEIYS